MIETSSENKINAVPTQQIPKEGSDRKIHYGNHTYVKDPKPGFPHALKRDDDRVFQYGLELSEA